MASCLIFHHVMLYKLKFYFCWCIGMSIANNEGCVIWFVQML